MRMVKVALSLAVGVALLAVNPLENAWGATAKKPVATATKKGAGLAAAVKTLATAPAKAKATTTYTLAQVKALLPQPITKLTVGALAAMYFVLEMEDPAGFTAFKAKVAKRIVVRNGKNVDTGPEIVATAADLKSRHGAPCSGQRSRVGATWPPHYDCKEAGPVAKPSGPTPQVLLRAQPTLAALRGDADQKKEIAREDNALRDTRLSLFKQRDAFTVPGENLKAPPTQFCVKGKCMTTYLQVAAALYGTAAGSDRLPIFCVPKSVGGKWPADKVECTGTWLETLNWAPWKANGEPNDPPTEPVIPPYSCVGNPHFFDKHVVIPAGGAAGKSGFYCRKRIFRILATKAERSTADVNANIANLCREMRQQVWGEKYKDINMDYQKWCMSAKGPKDKTLCPQLKLSADGKSMELPPLPFMPLSREEVFYYFGHKEYYCRADRAGLTHFLYNDKWAEKFTCGVDRGLIEAGPFEEGVQLCALSPYVGEKAPQGLIDSPFKARMHCWQFNRPTCEMAMLDGKEKDEQKKIDSIHRSSVFDVFDVLKEYRRTRLKKIFSLLDLKDAEKLQGFNDVYSYSDNANDEGVFGVKEFCRFVGTTKTIQCGYDKKQMESWYELRRNEVPLNCMTGVCTRGSFERGYLCGVFQAPDMFANKPYWMCGLDIGLKGRAMLTSARAICLGGKPFQDFLSPKGEQGTMNCFERRFRWAESSESREMLERFDFDKMLATAAAPVVADIQKDEPRQSALIDEAIVEARKTDIPQLQAWIKQHGHTLGHRTSMRIGLTRATGVQVVQDFLKIAITDKDIIYVDPDVKKDKEAAAKTAKAKDVNELISDFRKGDRAPDAKWLFEWFKEAVEGGNPHIARPRIVLGIRVSMLFQVLDGARKLLQKYARDYADQVLKKAKTANALSRLEVHERAREETFEKEGIRGNLYCVPDSPPSIDGATSPASRYYACASSPLLVMGMVEQNTLARESEFDPSGDTPEDNARLLEEFREKSRKQTKSEWCYGSSKGKTPFGGINNLTPLLATDLSSPYQMELPTNALDRNNREYGVMFHPKEPKLWTNQINWLKCAGFQYNDENWQRAVANKGKNGPGGSGGGGGGGDGGGALMGLIGGFVSSLLTSALGPVGDFKKLIDDIVNPAGEFLKEWTQQFVDLAKDQWDASQEKIKDAEETMDQKIEAAKAAAEQAQQDLDTAKVDTQAALDKLRDEQQQELDKTEAEAEKSTWDGREKALQAEVKKAEAEPMAKADAAEAWKQAKEDAKAGEQEAKDTVRKAKQAMADALKDQEVKNKEEITAKTQALKEAKKTFETTTKEQTKLVEQLKVAEGKANSVIKGSAKLFDELIEAMVKMATERVMTPLSPIVRDLFGKAFSWVRRGIGLVAKGLIAAAGSIPFVGGALAALISAALDAALDAIEDLCVEQLTGIVERIVAKMVRATIPAVQKPMQQGILKQIHSACALITDREGKSVCPGDADQLKFAELPPEKQWLNRALACSRGPILDNMLAQIRRDAVVARQRLHEQLDDFRVKAPAIARSFIDGYFRRQGTTYEEWMAWTGGHPGGISRVAQVQTITDSLNKLGEEAKKRKYRNSVIQVQ